MRDGARLLALAVIVALLGVDSLMGQSFRRAGTEFNAIRTVTLPAGKSFSTVVTQFYHHGELAHDGATLVVVAKNQRRVPVRVLQLGPGDYCRMAFQTLPGQTAYEILYGGQGTVEEAAPAWTSADGLFLETREFASCNLHSLDAVRKVFDSAKPIGADYVDAVHHAENPFTLRPAPFLSRYSGTLRLAQAGKYTFFTSSQDCSFLLVDDKAVISAPGCARAASPCRAWFVQGSEFVGGKPQVRVLPRRFGQRGGDDRCLGARGRRQAGADSRGGLQRGPGRREPAGPVSLHNEKMAPDFLVNLSGSVPLPDDDVPLVGVQFVDASPKALSASARYLWEFGDGQTSEKASPLHVFLHPGLYSVKLTIRRGGRPYEMVNRVYVDQPQITDPSKLHQLDDYLPVVETYEPRTLDARALRQLVLAYQAKADALLAAASEKPAAESTANARPSGGKKLAKGQAPGGEARRWVRRSRRG